MKRTTLYISAALALALALAACTKEDTALLPEASEGTPMTFTATGLNPAATAAAGTRAPVDGDWEGVQSVAVMIGDTVKAYDVTPTTADNTSATLTSTDPHYWADHNDLRVTAWWPYTAGETAMPVVKVRQDQSTQDGYEGSDFIAAEEQAVSYANPTLHFTHRTARVTVALTDRPEESMNVQLTGLSTVDGNPAAITPHAEGNDTYAALVAPQTVAAGTAFITCTFTSGKSFVYKMKKNAEWKAGEEYTYTVSLAAADPGYTVSADGKTYTVYTAEGLLAWNEAVQKDMSLNCTLAADITLPEVTAADPSNWTPMGTASNPYTGTFEGGGHTITGLTVELSNQNNVGLIGYLGNGGKVQNLTLAEVKINGGSCVGGMVGNNNSNGTVTACTVSGDVTGSGNWVGGVVGFNNRGTVTGCTVSGDVTGSGNWVGGVVGFNNRGTVTPETTMSAAWWDTTTTP